MICCLITVVGCIFFAGYDNFLSFLCGINGSAPVVLNYTGHICKISTMMGSDLNLPSVTISLLNQSRTVMRRVTNIANDEHYSVSCSAPYGVSVSVSPTRFFIASGQQQSLTIVLGSTMNSTSASFGGIGLYGNLGHKLFIPLSVISKTKHKATLTRKRCWLFPLLCRLRRPHSLFNLYTFWSIWI